MADVDDLVARLEALSEDLADLVLEALRAQAEGGDDAEGQAEGAAAAERRYSRARRSVERAIAILGGREAE